MSAGILAESEIAPPLRGILRRRANARVLLAEITGFDLERREAHALAPHGEPLTLPYDSLIVAAGASHSYAGRDERAPVAPPLKTLADAREVRSRILRAFELAGQIAELSRGALRPDYRRIDTATATISLLEGRPALLPGWAEELSARAAEDLGELGVDVRTRRTALSTACPPSHPPRCSRAGTRHARSDAGCRRGAPGTFAYRDKGTLAVVGHDRAVGLAFGVPVTGLGAMLIWALVHVRHLVGWGNRLTTTLRWLWTLLARDRAERVIATPEGALKDLSSITRRTALLPSRRTSP